MTTDTGGSPVLRMPLSHPVRGVLSTRIGGESRRQLRWQNLGGGVGDDHATLARNWSRLLRSTDRRPQSLLRIHQVHGCGVLVAGRDVEAGQEPSPNGDAVVTNRIEDTLVVLVADCTPVFLFDPASGVLGLAHAGWRGALSGIPAETVAAMERLGARAGRIAVWIGPRVGVCCYEVDGPLADRFRKAFPEQGTHRPIAIPSGTGHARLDLGVAIAHSLRQAGIAEDTIGESALCTACRTDLLYSHRGEGGRTGRMAALLWREAAV